MLKQIQSQKFRTGQAELSKPIPICRSVSLFWSIVQHGLIRISKEHKNSSNNWKFGAEQDNKLKGNCS